MSGVLNLIIGSTNLGQVVTSSKRSQVNDGIIEHRTVNGNIRVQYMYKKYIYEFECLSTVEKFENLIGELDYDNVKYVSYDKTGWNTTGSGVKCSVIIDEEDYSDFLQQPQDGSSTSNLLNFKITCKEI